MSLNKIKINDNITVNTGIVYDISKATGRTYDTLADALGVEASNVPLEVREGGMIIRYILTIDNTYIQYRYMLQYENTTTGNNNFLNSANWQGIDKVPTINSHNLVESGGIEATISSLDISRIEFGDCLYVWKDDFHRTIVTITSDFKLKVYNASGNVVFSSDNVATAAAVSALNNHLTQEENRAKEAENYLNLRLTNEIDDSKTAVGYTDYLYVWRDNFNRPIAALKSDFSLLVFDNTGSIVFSSKQVVKTSDFNNLSNTVSDNTSHINLLEKEIEKLKNGGVESVNSILSTKYVYIWNDSFNQPIFGMSESHKLYKFDSSGNISPVGDYVYDIWMPHKIYILNGTKMLIFKASLSPFVNPDANMMNIKKGTNATVGINRDSFYEYDVNSNDSDFKATFGIYSDQFGYRYAENDTLFVHVSKATSPAFNVNVLMIGDSFTEEEFYPSELRRLITSINETYYCDLSGTVSTDSLQNVTFIGTQGMNNRSTACPCEGYAGMHYGFFATNDFQTPLSPPRYNPFWNPQKEGENKVDFDYYCSEHGYSGIDIAIILLGTNGLNNSNYIKIVWDALIAHNSDIKIIVAGRCFACPYGPGYVGKLDSNQTFISLSENVISVNKQLQNLAESDEYKNNVTYVEYRVQLDNRNNMSWKNGQANNRNPNVEIRMTDNNVHPNKFGYWQIADAMRPALHKVLNEINS